MAVQSRADLAIDLVSDAPAEAAASDRHDSIAAGSSQLQIERLAALLARLDLELHVGAFAQVLEIHLGRKARAMEKNFVPAVVRGDETETLVLDHFLDCAKHAMNSSAA